MTNATSHQPAELTWRSVALGTLITIAFTAANLAVGLKVGLSFATSIPAAVISMAVLRGFTGSTIRENNIVQTIASAAGTMASIAFVLPGLVMIGWWKGFDYWTTFWVCASGGLTGVLFSVPLRRTLVTGSDLPYPEGVAAAAVLQVGSREAAGAGESRTGLRVLLAGSLASAGYTILSATQIVAGEVEKWFRLGPIGSGVNVTLSFALIGAGHIVGSAVGIAIFAGIVLGFGIVTPLLTFLRGTPDAASVIWHHDVRFFGVGVIAMAALWTFGRLVVPIARGLAESAAASRSTRSRDAAVPIEEQDLSMRWLIGGFVILLFPIGLLIHNFVVAGPLAPMAAQLTAAGVLYVIIVGAIVAAVCGYMAGLIGSSNSPVSGLGILGVLGAGLLLAFFVKPHATPAAVPQMVALAIFWTAIIFSTAAVANDNLQDLKTGQLIGATPWKQQVALMIGVLVGSAIIPFVLSLLARAYGFAPLVGAPPPSPLGAPQATLIATLAKGVLGSGLDWQTIGAGGLAGGALIALDGLLARTGKTRLPPLAVGLGIYLPMGIMLPVVVGALIGHFFMRRAPTEEGRRTGVLLASGFIVGDGLTQVMLAGLVVATGSGVPLALVGDSFAGTRALLALPVFAALLAMLYRWTVGQVPAKAIVHSTIS